VKPSPFYIGFDTITITQQGHDKPLMYNSAVACSDCPGPHAGTECT